FSRRCMMNRRAFLFAMTSLVIAALIPGCKQGSQVTGPKYGTSQPSKTVPVYYFAVHPLHNPTKLMHDYQPLMDYLNRRLKGARLTLEASRDYANFEVKYQTRKPEFLLANPWHTLQAIKTGYRVIAMAGEPKDFKGIFLVRKDGRIRKPADLKGKA